MENNTLYQKKNSQYIMELRFYFAKMLRYNRKNKIEYKPALYSILRHCSASGMMRVISTKILIDNQILDIDYKISMVTSNKLDRKHNGIKISGAGMDMGFAIVNDLMHSVGIKNWQNKFRQEWI